MTTFNERIEVYFEDQENFVLSAKEIHDMSGCTRLTCEFGTFGEKLYTHVFCRRRSPRFVKIFSLVSAKCTLKLLLKNKKKVIDLFSK